MIIADDVFHFWAEIPKKRDPRCPRGPKRLTTPPGRGPKPRLGVGPVVERGAAPGLGQVVGVGTPSGKKAAGAILFGDSHEHKGQTKSYKISGISWKKLVIHKLEKLQYDITIGHT